MTCDGTELHGESYTPIVLRFLNWPRQVRSRLGALKLAGWLPPKVRDYQNHLRPVAEQLQYYAPGSGSPMRVHDAASGQEIDVYIELAWIQNDIRGIPSTTDGRSPPCLQGGCNGCHTEGCTISGYGATIMPGIRTMYTRMTDDIYIYTRIHFTYIDTQFYIYTFYVYKMYV